MRQVTCRLLAMFALAALLAGCGSASTQIGERNVTGHSAIFGYTVARADGTGVSVIVGGKKLHVSQRQVTWNDGAYDLPDSWKNVDLKDSSGGVKVIVDGKEMTSIKI